MDRKRLKILNDLEKRLGYRFSDINLLFTALTHSSYVNENQQPVISSNERFEFLGDSVLGVCVSDMLVKKYINSAEGDLTKIRAALVNEKNLAWLARDLKIGDCLLIGRGEENAGSRDKDSFLADAFEAVVAAVYLDSDFGKIKDFLIKLIEPLLEKDKLSDDYFDYKTALQEFCHERYKTTPIYQLINSTGPEHAKIFEVRVIIANKLMENGCGKSKKEAEKLAARRAWVKLHNEEE